MVRTPDTPAKPYRVTHYTHGDARRHDHFSTAPARDSFARQLAEDIGDIVYTSRWEPTPQSLWLNAGWVVDAHLQPGCPDDHYVTLSLTVDNIYERYSDVTTTFENVRLPAPPDDPDGFNTWSYHHLHPFTGVGHEDGDAWYDVTITACSDPSLNGREITFGY